MALLSFLPGACTDDISRDSEFLSATLESLRRCPARGEYVELCFTTAEGEWSWCFPEPARTTAASIRKLAATDLVILT